MPLRFLVVAALAATVLLTWPLWQARSVPPMVPLLELPAPSLGVALLLALGLSLVRAGAGCAALTAIFAWAASVDQTRLQPEIVSLLFLLAATTSSPGARLIGRVHLITLWFYAGLHKLLSVPFMTDERPWLLWNLLADPPDWMVAVFPVSVVAAEIGLGLAALVPAMRRLVGWGALGLHGGILLALIPYYNPAVWPWNVVLAASGFLLVTPWQRSIATELRQASPPVRLVALVLAVFPLGFYTGRVDPALAHCLYANNTPAGFICRADGERMTPRPGLNSRYIDTASGRDCLAIDTESAGLGVPAPPRTSYFEAYFDRDCRPGEVLLVLPPGGYDRPADTRAVDGPGVRTCPNAPLPERDRETRRSLRPPPLCFAARKHAPCAG